MSLADEDNPWSSGGAFGVGGGFGGSDFEVRVFGVIVVCDCVLE